MPSIEWAKFIDGSGNESGLKTVTDTSGFVYFAGYTSTSGLQIETVSGTVTKINSNNQAGIVIKYSSSGLVQWVRFIDSNSTDKVIGITTDNSNNVYITGVINNQSFTIATVSGTVVNTNEGSSAFVIKYDSAGVAQWAQFIGTEHDEEGVGITVDLNENVYVCGHSSLNTNLLYVDPNTNAVLPTPSETGIFLVKYDSSGTSQWVKFIDGANIEMIGGKSIDTDADGNIYLAGYTNSSGFGIHVGSAIVTKPQTTTYGAFIVKYNESGDAQWAKFIDGSGDDYFESVCVDSSGYVYAIGATNTSGLAIDTVSGTVMKPSVDYAIFTLKYNTNGVIQWAKFIDSDNYERYPYDIVCDNYGNAYVCGSVLITDSVPTLIIRTISGAVTVPYTNGAYTSLLIKYNIVGDCEWVEFLYGSDSVFTYGTTIDPSGNLYLVGKTSASGFSIGTSSGTITKPNNFLEGAFIVKYTGNISNPISYVGETGIFQPGSVSFKLTNLQSNTIYYARPYVRTRTGYFYGNTILVSTGNYPPTVSSQPVTNVQALSATGNGEINVNGGGLITTRGFVWSTLPNPTISLSTKTVETSSGFSGFGLGAFSGTLSPLFPAIFYYVRAYATSIYGTSYGATVNMQTPTAPPYGILNSVSIVSTSGQATISGTQLATGGRSVTERGFVWSLIGEPLPTTSVNAGKLTYTSGGFTNGGFSGTATGLSTVSGYTVRAYFINSLGTYYSNDQPMRAVLFPFTDHLFTSAGATGRYGPTLSQIQSAYSYTSWASNTAYLNMTTQGVQEWSVPKTATYRITAVGAASGRRDPILWGGSSPGIGPFITVDRSLTQGDKLYIVVGQMGTNETRGDKYGPSGGGGTFVYRMVNNSPEYIVVAGGGGGSGSGWYSSYDTRAGDSRYEFQNGKNTVIYEFNTENIIDMCYGGMNGNGGGTGGIRITNSSLPYGGFGAGVNSDGYTNNGAQGRSRGNGWIGGFQLYGLEGGFGGGGGSGNNLSTSGLNMMSGGGGGYSGGAAGFSPYTNGSESISGGGGGSYYGGGTLQYGTTSLFNFSPYTIYPDYWSAYYFIDGIKNKYSSIYNLNYLTGGYSTVGPGIVVIQQL